MARFPLIDNEDSRDWDKNDSVILQELRKAQIPWEKMRLRDNWVYAVPKIMYFGVLFTVKDDGKFVRYGVNRIKDRWRVFVPLTEIRAFQLATELGSDIEFLNELGYVVAPGTEPICSSRVTMEEGLKFLRDFLRDCGDITS